MYKLIIGIVDSDMQAALSGAGFEEHQIAR